MAVCSPCCCSVCIEVVPIADRHSVATECHLVRSAAVYICLSWLIFLGYNNPACIVEHACPLMVGHHFCNDGMNALVRGGGACIEHGSCLAALVLQCWKGLASLC